MTRAKALRTASRFGLILDESVSGKIDDNMTVTFDHPTHSFGGDCRSITVSMSGVRASEVWAEAIDRMEIEGPYLTPCTCGDCDYHAGEPA